MSGRNRGFGIVEVLIALLLFSIGILAISSLFPLSIKNVETSQDILIATEILTATIELLNQPSETIQSRLVDGRFQNTFQPIRELVDIDLPNRPGYDDDVNPLIERYIGFERQILIESLSAEIGFGPRVRVVVTIRWTDSTGRQRSISMPSIIDINKHIYTGVG